MTREEREELRQAGKWMNAIADAWNEGRAPWAYPEGMSLAVQVWNEAGLEGVKNLATEHGIRPKKH